MKKLIAVLLAAITAVSICVVTAFAEENLVRARDLNSSALTEYIDGVKVTTLSKSKKLKGAKLKLAADEMLIIGENVVLTLQNGADISGTVYIESGGKLLLAGGEAVISESGTVFSDGTLSINKSAKLNVRGGGTVFVGKGGTMRTTAEKSLSFDEFSNIVCIGRTNSKNAVISKKAVDAYIYENGKLRTDKNPLELLPSGNDFCTDLVKSGESTQRLIFVFDSGACIKAEKVNDRFANIGGCNTAIVGMKRQNGGSGIGYSRIYEIDGSDYVYDMKGVTEFAFDENGAARGYEASDNSAVKKALKNFSEKKYIGKFPDGNAKMYRISDSAILVIWKDADETYSAAGLIKI